MAGSAPLHRPEFEAALRAFARATEAMRKRGFEAPVLVGGAAVELYTASTITTGDFDLVTGREDAFEEILLQQGFSCPPGPGHTPTGWVHADLGLGFEIVSRSLLDGKADRDRIRLFAFEPDGVIAVISVEDMIADRMGQYASGSAPDMLDQAQILLTLHPGVDLAYLERRIREETAGEQGIASLEA
jgi:hypothetical protein